MFELLNLLKLLEILALMLHSFGLFCDVTSMYNLNLSSPAIDHRTGTNWSGIVHRPETTSDQRRDATSNSQGADHRSVTTSSDHRETITLITRYTRSELFALRRQPKNDDYVQVLHEAGLLRFRGNRGGASTRSRKGRSGMIPTSGFRLTLDSEPDSSKQQEQVYKIETIIRSRFGRSYHENKEGRRISNLINITCQNDEIERKEGSKLRITKPPNLYVLNAAALTKPHATEQLHAEMLI